MNIGLLLDMAVQACGERVAVGPRATGITYDQLREQATRVAGTLDKPGTGRLVLVAESSDACPAMLFGSALIGVPFCAVNYRLADDRLRAVVSRTTPATVVVDEASRGRLEGIEGATLVDAADLFRGEPTEADPAVADPDGDGVAISLFTSGTTGDPKSVLLRHGNLFSYIVGTTELGAADSDEAALVSVPPYHIAGLAAILSNVYLGRRIVYLPQFDAAEWVRLAHQERITHAMIVPTMLGRILDAIEESGVELTCLRALSYGGGRMPLAMIRRAMRLLPHVDFVNAYGLTETSSTICLLTPDDHREAAAASDPDVAARLGSVGRAVPGVEVEIRGPETGQPLSAGEIGEVFVRGDQVSGEYEGNRALDDGGWFPTKDVGMLDEDGFLFLKGRADDVIVRGGENLSPGEIEETLLAHPAVAEAAVVGIPDREWGEAPAAVVVPVPGESVDADELKDWVRSSLRSSRMPTVVVERTALPYSETGKLLRRVLRDELTAHA